MPEQNFLAEQFEASRSHLHAVAYRMLGSRAEAEDAVQEAWLKLARSDASQVANLGGWLTTVTARVCLDMLRARKSRREDAMGGSTPEPALGPEAVERETLLADSVGLALMVVLERLSPAERLAFVLHDLFGVPFDEIAAIVERTPEAARQLASRARRRVQGGEPAGGDRVRQRQVVDAFLAASREGNFQALLSLLDPQVVFRADAVAARMGARPEVHGAETVARFFSGRAAGARPILIDGEIGLLVAPAGRLRLVLRLAIEEGRISGVEAVADPETLAGLDLAVA